MLYNIPLDVVFFISIFKGKIKRQRNIIEPPRGKTNNVVSDQVRHKPTCTFTEKN